MDVPVLPSMWLARHAGDNLTRVKSHLSRWPQSRRCPFRDVCPVMWRTGTKDNARMVKPFSDFSQATGMRIFLEIVSDLYGSVEAAKRKAYRSASFSTKRRRTFLPAYAASEPPCFQVSLCLISSPYAGSDSARCSPAS